MSSSEKPLSFSPESVGSIQDDLGLTAKESSDRLAQKDPAESIQDELPPQAPAGSVEDKVADNSAPSKPERHEKPAEPWPPRHIALVTYCCLAGIELMVVALRTARTDFEVGAVSTFVSVFLGVASVGVFVAMAYFITALQRKSWVAASRSKNLALGFLAFPSVVLLALTLSPIINFPDAVVLWLVGIPVLVMVLVTAGFTAELSVSAKGATAERTGSPLLVAATAIGNVLWAHLFVALLATTAAERPSAIQSAATIPTFAAIFVAIRLTAKGTVRRNRPTAVVGQALFFVVLGVFTWAAFGSENSNVRGALVALVLLQAAFIWWTASQPSYSAPEPIDSAPEPSDSAPEPSDSAPEPSSSDEPAGGPQDSLPTAGLDEVVSNDAGSSEDQPEEVELSQSAVIAVRTFLNVIAAYVAGGALWFATRLFEMGGRTSELAVVIAVAALATYAAIALITIGLLRDSRNTVVLGIMMVQEVLLLSAVSLMAFAILTNAKQTDAAFGVAPFVAFVCLWLSFIFFIGTQSGTSSDQSEASTASSETASPLSASAEPRPEQLLRPEVVMVLTVTNMHWIALILVGLFVRDLPISPSPVLYAVAGPMVVVAFCSMVVAWPSNIIERPRRVFLGNWALFSILSVLIVTLVSTSTAKVGFVLLPLLALQGVVAWWTTPSNRERILVTP